MEPQVSAPPSTEASPEAEVSIAAHFDRVQHRIERNDRLGRSTRPGDGTFMFIGITCLWSHTGMSWWLYAGLIAVGCALNLWGALRR